MAENPNLIRRPLMKIEGKLLVGFDAEEASAAFRNG
jgi:arsenate reductase-like glutaredoxin family protein